MPGLHARGKHIEPEDLPAALRLQLEARSESPNPLAGQTAAISDVSARTGRTPDALTTAMREAGGNKSKAAEWLGIWRARLIRRLDALGLGKEDQAP